MTFYFLCRINEVLEGELREFILKEVEILAIFLDQVGQSL